MVADALSKKSHCNTIMIRERQPTLHEEFQRLNLELVKEHYVAALEVKPTLEEQIRLAQGEGQDIRKIKASMKRGVTTKFSEDEQGTIWYRKHLVVTTNKELKGLSLMEDHESSYTVHPSSTKMY